LRADKNVIDANSILQTTQLSLAIPISSSRPLVTSASDSLRLDFKPRHSLPPPSAASWIKKLGRGRKLQFFNRQLQLSRRWDCGCL